MSSFVKILALLKRARVSSIKGSETHLLHFLEAVHPATLTLTNVRLVSGTYASIFQYLTGPDSPVTYYHLDGIREGNALAHFDVPGSSKFRYRGRHRGAQLTHPTK
jgi:hypothetical protein